MTTFESVITSDSAADLYEAMEQRLSIGGLTAFMQGFADPYLRARAKARFASEGDDATGKWAPLSHATVAIRESQGFPGEHPINRRTGDLERHITQSRGDILPLADEGVQLTLPGQTGDAEMLLKIEKAQTGRRSGRPGVARPVLAFGSTDLGAMMQALSTYAATGGHR